jgi:molybdenum cofactor synthesis domain-containing protein
MFRKLLTFEEAKQALAQQLKPKPLGTESIPLLEAHNRIIAQDVVSALDIPPFDRSTVDGYAIKAQDTYGADENQPVKVKICGMVNIGEMPKLIVKNGEAAEIVTGAPIPEGAEAVVMIEDTNRENDDLTVYNAVTIRENVMKKGTDIQQGQTVLKAGTTLGFREIGVLAALGNAKVDVYKVPVVAVLSTGGELIEPGKELSPGKIFDINAYSLSAAISESGANPIYIGVVPDDKNELRRVLKHALSLADVVVTSGGVSIGPTDIMPHTLNSLGESGIIFSGVAVKPGKPVTAALIGQKPVFSFPGHPTAALLMFHLLARPILQIMGGKIKSEAVPMNAIAKSRMFSAKGRRTFVMVHLKRDASGRLFAESVESGASGAITTLAKADGYVEIAENVQFIDIDEEVKVWLFRENK